MKTKKWDYKGYTHRAIHGRQEDWNQTIVTMINILSDMKEGKIIVPLKLKSIFDSLILLDEETNILADKYKIDYVDTKHSVIYVNLNAKLEVINFN